MEVILTFLVNHEEVRAGKYRPHATNNREYISSWFIVLPVYKLFFFIYVSIYLVHVCDK